MRYWPFQSMRGRRHLLRHPLTGFGKLALGLGIFFFLLGIVLFTIIDAAVGDRSASWIMILAISSQGVVWGIVGMVIMGVINSHTKKLRDLKQTGKRYEAEIIHLSPMLYVNVSFHTPSVYAECIYVNDQQQRCKVKSPMFLWENLQHDKLQAVAYVDWNNPRRYAVEITERENPQAQFDVDYT